MHINHAGTTRVVPYALAAACAAAALGTLVGDAAQPPLGIARSGSHGAIAVEHRSAQGREQQDAPAPRRRPGDHALGHTDLRPQEHAANQAHSMLDTHQETVTPHWVDVGLIGAVELNADYAGSDLGQSDLRWAQFLKPDFSDAILVGANLSGAVVIEGNLDGVVLIDAHIRAANLGGTSLQQADLSWAMARATSFVGSMMAESVLHEADLRSTNFSAANLDNADLSGADLRRAFLVGTNLHRADLSDADLRDANLADANLEGANLSGASVEAHQLTRACGNQATRLPVHLEDFVLNAC